jgi:hypothetical protein
VPGAPSVADASTADPSDAPQLRNRELAPHTFLRKLIQLPLPVPRVVADNVTPLLDGLLPLDQAAAETGSVDQPSAAGDETFDAPASASAAEPIATTPTVRALEHDPRVRARITERLRAQPVTSLADP